MTIKTKELNYKHGGLTLAAHIAWKEQDAVGSPKPAVLICHDAMGGKSDFEKGRAQALAELGYVGIAIDTFGHDQRAATSEQAYAMIDPLIANRKLLRERLLSGLEFARQQPQVDADNVAVIGYCFGGLCALEFARSGADIKAAASFHGLLSCDESVPTLPIQAKLLVLHGWSDPIVPAEQVLSFSQEMTKLNADWQLVSYGNGLHGFSNPLANDPNNGIGYDALIERRSWLKLENFLTEVFS